MIHFYVAKPRNGKSLRVMMRIIQILTESTDWVVVNQATGLKYPELQEYLDAKGHDIHVLDRVYMLDDVQAKNFWLHRGPFLLPKCDGYDDSKASASAANVDYAPVFMQPEYRVPGNLTDVNGAPTPMRAVTYVIDEVQNLWPARDWQGTSRHLMFYLSQHGKFGDTVIFVTQNVKNVDRVLYSLAQDFTYCRNHRMEKHGKFRGDNKFVAKTYPAPVTTGEEVTLNVEEYPLDLEIANCYDTSAGVGMPGGGKADAGFRAKGISLKWVWVGVAVAVVVFFGVFQFVIPRVTRRFLGPVVAPNARGVPSGGLPSVSKAADVVAAPTLGLPVVPELAGLWLEQVEGRLVVHALLGNGREIPPSTVQAVNLDGLPAPWVEALGVRYHLRAKKPPSARAETALEFNAKQVEGAPTRPGPVASSTPFQASGAAGSAANRMW